MVILLKHEADWKLIFYQKQDQINKYSIHEKGKRLDHYYKVGDKFMLNNSDAFIYEILYTVKLDIT